jgi:hypothetical protein
MDGSVQSLTQMPLYRHGMAWLTHTDGDAGDIMQAGSHNSGVV